MFAGPLPESLDDVRWGSRKAQVDKLYHYAGPHSRGSGLAAIVAGSQRVQAAGLQAGIEGRRLARETTGGVAFWQFNEPWPAVSWSVIDRFGRPKAAYQMLCRSYQPVLIALRFQNRACLPGEMGHAEVWLVNDGPSAWSDCRADAHLRDAQLWSAEGLALPAGGVVCAGSLTWRATPSQGVVRLRLFCGQAELATNLYDLDVPIAGPGPRSARWRQALASYLLRAD